MSSTIKTANHALRNALDRGDSAAVGALYADHAVLVAPSAQLLQGREAIERFWQTGIEVGIESVELRSVMARQRGLFAYGLGSYRWRVRSSATKTASDDGAYLVILERDAARRWKRVLDFFDSTYASAPQGSDHPAWRRTAPHTTGDPR